MKKTTTKVVEKVVEKTAIKVVENVVEKNPGKPFNFMMLKAMEELHPEIKTMSFKEFQKKCATKGFTSFSTICDYLHKI